MVTIAIVAILAAIAIPSYTDYITRSKIQEATTALLAMRTKMEQYFQDNRTYTQNCVIAPTAPTAAQIQLPQGKYFAFTCQGVTNVAQQYTDRTEPKARRRHSPTGRMAAVSGRIRCSMPGFGLAQGPCQSGWQCVQVELAAGGDSEFRVGLVQVIADRPGAEEELGRDVTVGQPLRGQPGNL